MNPVPSADPNGSTPGTATRSVPSCWISNMGLFSLNRSSSASLALHADSRVSAAKRARSFLVGMGDRLGDVRLDRDLILEAGHPFDRGSATLALSDLEPPGEPRQQQVEDHEHRADDEEDLQERRVDTQAHEGTPACVHDDSTVPDGLLDGKDRHQRGVLGERYEL